MQGPAVVVAYVFLNLLRCWVRLAAAVRLRTAVALQLVAGQLWAAVMTRNPRVPAATRSRPRPVSNLKGSQQLSAQESRLGLHQVSGRRALIGGRPFQPADDREPPGYSPRLMGLGGT